MEHNIGCHSITQYYQYDQEIPQSQTADKPEALRGRATQQSRDTRKADKANQSALSSTSR